MDKTRWIATAAAVAVLAVGGVAYGVSRDGGGDGSAAPAASSSTTVAPGHDPSSSTTEPATTSSTTKLSTSTSSTLPLDDGVLRQGQRGPAIAAVQRRLLELHFDPGGTDGAFGQSTVYAVQGFEKLAGLPPDGNVGTAVLDALAHPPTVTPLVPNGGATRVEVDLRRQLLFVYQGGAIRLISHVSTGSGKSYCVDGSCNNRAITPIGSFRFAWRSAGWRVARLGKLYNPVYFTDDGVAVHGALSVPTYPASHGCVRIPMNIAEYFPSLVQRGDPIYVTDGRQVGPPAATPTGPPPSDAATTPGDDTSTTTTSSSTTTTSPRPTTSTTSPPKTTTTSTTSPSTTTTTTPAPATTTP